MRKILTLLLLLILVLAPGCGKKINGAVQQAWDDASLAAKIKTRLAAKGGLNYLRLEILVENAVARLSGEVKTEKEKNSIEELAGSVEGVKSVKNEITVNAAAVTMKDLKNDLVIQGRIQAALFQEEGLRGLNIFVSSERGRVTLRGKVKYPEQKDVAEKIANAVPGVKDLSNRIEVIPPAAQVKKSRESKSSPPVH
ncbi:MAG: BON domain-containing protein [bacterium]